MEYIYKLNSIIVSASEGNPLISICLVFLLYLAFNGIEAQIEKLFFNERFLHWLDPIFGILFIFFAVYVVYGCSIYNKLKV